MPRHNGARHPWKPPGGHRKHKGHRMHRRNRPARRAGRIGQGRLRRRSPWGRWGVV